MFGLCMLLMVSVLQAVVLETEPVIMYVPGARQVLRAMSRAAVAPALVRTGHSVNYPGDDDPFFDEEADVAPGWEAYAEDPDSFDPVGSAMHDPEGAGIKRFARPAGARRGKPAAWGRSGRERDERAPSSRQRAGRGAGAHKGAGGGGAGQRRDRPASRFAVGGARRAGSAAAAETGAAPEDHGEADL